MILGNSVNPCLIDFKVSPPPILDFSSHYNCSRHYVNSFQLLEKDVQNITSKQIFARWHAILSVFYFNIEYIEGSENSISDFLTREFLRGKNVQQ